MSPQSSDKQMMEYRGVNSASHLKFHTKMKITKSSLVQKLVLLVHTWGKELVPLVQGGHLRFEHDRVLFRQAKSAGLVVGLKVVCCCRIFHLTSNSLPSCKYTNLKDTAGQSASLKWSHLV